MKVANLEPEIPYFSNYTVQSKTAQPYFVEIRSLSKHNNSCSCTDYDINGLGTCKHIEKVLLTLRKKGKRFFKEADRTGSLRTEIYVDPIDYQVKLAWAQEINDESVPLLKGFFSANRSLIADAKTTIPVLAKLLSNAPAQFKNAFDYQIGSLHWLILMKTKPQTKSSFYYSNKKSSFGLNPDYTNLNLAKMVITIRLFLLSWREIWLIPVSKCYNIIKDIDPNFFPVRNFG